MADRYFSGPDGHGTDTESPIDYFPGQNKRARRFTLYRNNLLVLFFDYYVEGDTRYGLYIEVDPVFRDGKWLEIITQIKNIQPDYLQEPRVVWLRVSPWLAKSLPKLVATREALLERDAAFAATVYIEGAINDHIIFGGDS